MRVVTENCLPTHPPTEPRYAKAVHDLYAKDVAVAHQIKIKSAMAMLNIAAVEDILIRTAQIRPSVR